jgi:hypothetical protein
MVDFGSRMASMNTTLCILCCNGDIFLIYWPHFVIKVEVVTNITTHET